MCDKNLEKDIQDIKFVLHSIAQSLVNANKTNDILVDGIGNGEDKDFKRFHNTLRNWENEFDMGKDGIFNMYDSFKTLFNAFHE